MVDKALAAWLLDSDPALRWQVERDVVGAPPAWPQSTPLAGRVWFEVDALEGEPSRWLTLQGTRVLRWWENA